ncbi:glycosyltransferase [Niveibacterium sp. 24ML]|uniref:glycosyltransferase family 32 protein n=1 Tax=Niveibacterium sp. 24ML TaxID=2985512 RepID=UPI0022710B43|nr:glycosyltransferase [Niveibacterium sp. 24ML]MCX9158044.1 glycosyltransferase [Niveibacterium sp. 24ML]
MSDSRERLGRGAIPKLIHQIWHPFSPESVMPREWARFAKSWQRHNPDYRYEFWSPARSSAFVRERFPELLSLYEGYQLEIERVDALRYMLLSAFGGIYVDLDVECLKPIDGLLAGHSAVTPVEPSSHGSAPGAQHFRQVLSTAFMASVPMHPLWGDVFAELLRSAGKDGSMETTGPYMLTRAFERSNHQRSVFLAPAESVYPLDEPECRTGEGYDLQVWCERTANAYAVHHWAGTWVSREGVGQAFQRSYPAGLPVTRYQEGCGEGEAGVIHNGLLEEGPTVLCVVPPGANDDDLKNAIASFRNQTYRSSKLVIALQPGEPVAKVLTSVRDPRVQTIEFCETMPSLWEGLQAITTAIPTDFIAVWRATDLSEPQRLAIAMTAAWATQAALVWFRRSLVWSPDSEQLGISESSFNIATALISRDAVASMALSLGQRTGLGTSATAVEVDAPNAICQLHDQAVFPTLEWQVPGASYQNALACLVSNLRLAE